MAKYKYVGGGAFHQNLPMADLDDADLTEPQKELLALGIAGGLYEPEGGGPKTDLHDPATDAPLNNPGPGTSPPKPEVLEQDQPANNKHFLSPQDAGDVPAAPKPAAG